MACKVVTLVKGCVEPVLLNSTLHASLVYGGCGPELFTHAASIFARVSICMSVVQLAGGEACEHCADVGRKLAGPPVAVVTRLVVANLAALDRPIVLLKGAPIFCPLPSAN